MTEIPDRQDLNERLNLIENMIAEGRQATGRWGWTFVLWGTAYLVAMAWQNFAHADHAWAVVMPITAVIGGILGARQRRIIGGAMTSVGRSMMAIWTSMGLALFFYGFGVGASGHGDLHTILGGIQIILGMAYAASSIVLRWKLQFACALVWWASAMVALFRNIDEARIGFAGATILCMILFGIYAMVRKNGCAGEVAHA